MKVRDLDCLQHTLNLSSFLPTDRPRSDYHLKARELLKEMYPLYMVLEEVTIPIERGINAYLDFFIPQLRLVVEVHGEQHFKFIPHFHKTQVAFLQQKKRDRQKKEWVKLNEMRLVELNYNEDLETWKQKISSNKLTSGLMNTKLD